MPLGENCITIFNATRTFLIQFVVKTLPVRFSLFSFSFAPSPLGAMPIWLAYALAITADLTGINNRRTIIFKIIIIVFLYTCAHFARVNRRDTTLPRRPECTVKSSKQPSLWSWITIYSVLLNKYSRFRRANPKILFRGWYYDIFAGVQDRGL